jgi:hypothetical protein
MNRIAIVVRTTDLSRQQEALRAAVGQTLRGATVLVVPLVVLAEGKALSTLRALGCVVNAELGELRGCHAVEVWS